MAMRVDILRDGRSGRVVYMETTRDFIEALGAVLHTPIGGLARSLGDGVDLGVSRVASHLASLRPELWTGDKEKMLPKAHIQGEKVERVLTENDCPVCDLAKDFSEAYTAHSWDQKSGSYCRPCGGGSRQPTTLGNCQVHCSECRQPAQVEKHRTTLENYARQQGHQVATRPKGSLPSFEKTVRFLVTDALEIFENSSIKSLELLSAARADLSNIQTETREVGQKQFRTILAFMLLNDKHALTDAFASLPRDGRSSSRRSSRSSSRSSSSRRSDKFHENI